MKPSRQRLTWALAAIAVVGALVLAFFNREPDPATAQQLATAALKELDQRTAREALAARCNPDSGEKGPFTTRSCTALQELATLENEPLAAATRLADLSRTRTNGRTARELVAEIQALRTELLIDAGHSRQAALEAQAWAEDRRGDASVGAVRLWVAAAQAQHAVGQEQTARDDAHLALQLARRTH